MRTLETASVDAVVTSPPYGVGKEYEAGLGYGHWLALMHAAFAEFPRLLRPGGFVVVVMADVRCHPDPFLPSVRAGNAGRRNGPTAEEMIAAVRDGRASSKEDLKRLFGCSDQTVDRRILGNNARGGKGELQTRVRLAAPDLDAAARAAGLCLYDARVWVKDPCWATCQYHAGSYRAVDEYEHVLVWSRPGDVIEVDRSRLSPKEWGEWGSRGVWDIPSVRANDQHPAMYPLSLATRSVRLWSPKGGTVLDPFLGSGTTGQACQMEGRGFIGIEQDESYFALAKHRVAEIQAGTPLFSGVTP
jgi:site-specific DNA-methyltransferase (adenine-specific)